MHVNFLDLKSILFQALFSMILYVISANPLTVVALLATR